MCVFGSHTFVPISWMCKKQTSVSHSSTKPEIISLDAGLRLDGIPALEIWDLIVFVLGNTERSQGMTNVFNRIDGVPSNVQSSHQKTLLYVFEDNEAMIKMIIPTKLRLIVCWIESTSTQKSKLITSTPRTNLPIF